MDQQPEKEEVKKPSFSKLRKAKRPQDVDFLALFAASDVAVEQLGRMRANLKYHDSQGVSILPGTWDLFNLMGDTKEALDRIQRIFKEYKNGTT